MNDYMTKLWAVLVACRIIWTLWPQCGYIHPDEFFQSTEIVVGDILNLDVERTWEFNSTQPLRSMLLPHLIYGLPVRLLAVLQTLGLFEISPYLLIVVPRLAITALMFTVDAVLWKSSKCLGIKPWLSLCLHASSYVTMTYLTRTLSNTIECLLFAIILSIAVPTFATVVHGNSSSSRRNRKRHRQQKQEEEQHSSIAVPVNTGTAKLTKRAATSRKSATTSAASSTVLVATKTGKGKQKSKKTKPNAKEEHQNVDNEKKKRAIAGHNTAPRGLQQPQQQQQKHSQKQHEQQQQKHSQKQHEQPQQKHSQKQHEQPQRKSQQHSQQQQQQKQQSFNSQKNHQTFSETISVNIDLCVLACCFIAGTFNRPTFPLFAAMPILVWFYCTSCSKPATLAKNVALFTLYSLPMCIVFITADTLYYSTTARDLIDALDSCMRYGESAGTTLCAWSVLAAHVTVTPFNFLCYNMQVFNLAEHGLHPFYLHVLVNMPLLYHILYILFFYNIYQCFARYTKLLSSSCVLSLFVVMPVVVLSMFPHQEPRFLVPILPVLVLIGASVIERCKWKNVVHLCCAWVISNIALALFYGLLHQGGVIPSLMTAQLNQISLSQDSTSISPPCSGRKNHLVFYHTYMVPKHLLLNRQGNVTLVTHDLKGNDMRSLTHLLYKLLSDNNDDDNNNKNKTVTVPEACSVRVVLPATLASGFKHAQQCSVHYLCEEEMWFTPHLSLEDPPLQLFGRTSSNRDWWEGWSLWGFFKDFHLKVIQIKKMP